MELEYRDERRRGRYIIGLGVILALAAGAAAFVLINQAQEQAASGPAKRVSVVVAVKTIPARQAITEGDVTIRQLPIDVAGAGIYDDASKLVNRVPAVTILEGQPVTSNLLASSEDGGQFSVLKPNETVSPDSPFWRAVAITVAPDLAVGGLLKPGMTVDVFLTASVTVPPSLSTATKYVSDKTTKIVYQDIEILAHEEDFYIIRLPIAQAEEIAHLQATAAVTFTFAMRPPEDTRVADGTKLGETTNLIIERYGLPIPAAITVGRGGIATSSGPVSSPAPSGPPAPTGSPAPTDSGAAASPAPSAP
jgi:Flp pilus assembly protein CpaB